MAPSWAKLVDTNRMPTPQERLNALAGFYSKQTNNKILLEALGAHKNIAPNMPAIAAPLVEHMVTICVDTESSTNNTDLLTELGLTQLKRSDARTVASSPGSHGVKIMELLRFFHFRVVEHAHLLSDRKDSRGPLGNRFGHTRFTTFKELRVVLQHIFNQPIESNDPALKGCMRPVVLVGHALRHDEENGKKAGLDYDFAANSTIVAKVDTQPLARELGVWVPHHTMRTNEIGLRVLIEERAMFKHTDDHTACNDAARTMICAIWMMVPASLKQKQPRTMQEAADHIEARSKDTSPNPYGTVDCCTRCGRRNHLINDCTVDVSCAACTKFDLGPGRDDSIKSHIETYCPHVAKFKAWARRYRDAYLKNRATGRSLSDEVLAGPGAEAHPWSTWRGPRDVMWPLKDLPDVLVGMALNTERPPFVFNMQVALGGLPVPSTGEWVRDASVAGMSSSVPPATHIRGPSISASSTENSAPARRVTIMSEQHGRGGTRSRGGRGDRSRGRGATGTSEPSSWGFGG
ncbi:nucleic acid binding [Ascochyta rabiei]|uniref:Nucleic acid binding n=2 Tax=Didymella rabiei TaxID=5454 RepID=A0A163L2Z5_DIDRA|nr:nucleic acid binding [Ascochyta rabiei]